MNVRVAPRWFLVAAALSTAACGGAGNEVNQSSLDALVEPESRSNPSQVPNRDGGVSSRRDAASDEDGGSLPAAADEDAGVTAAPDATAPSLPLGKEVFLYTGAGGGGPGTDLWPSAVASLYQGVGLEVTTAGQLPDDVSSRSRLLVVLNVLDPIPTEVTRAAQDILQRGGRVLIAMEHCKNGCWGNADANNDFLTALGSAMRLSGQGGAGLSATTLDVVSVAPLTDGVSSLIAFYSGSVDVGAGNAIAIGTVPSGDVVIGYEAVGGGEVVVVADGSMFGYVMASGDNETFLLNLAR